MCDVAELLDYWAKEPPAHVILALRYLGSSAKREKTEEEALAEMQQISAFMGQAPARMPDHLKRLVREAEEVKRKHGLARRG